MSPYRDPAKRTPHTANMKKAVARVADDVYSVLLQLVGEHHIERDRDGSEEEERRFIEVFDSYPLLFVAVQWTGYVENVPQPLEVCVSLTDMERDPIGLQTSVVNPSREQWHSLIMTAVLVRNLRAES